MSEGAFQISKAVPIIVLTWIISLVTTFAVVYVAPSIFPISVSTENIVDEAIIATKLADGTVTSAKVVDGTLTAIDIADGSILTVKIADGAVTTDKIDDGAVTDEKIDDEAITAAKIADGAIVTIKLADGSVTSAKILDGTVTAVDLANGSIITAKIANGAVTTGKIADGAVKTDKLADGAVTTDKLAAGAIPYNVTSFDISDGWIITDSTTWVNMTGTSVDITLTRNSTLLIMFSAMGTVDSAGDAMYWRAMVDSTVANPVSNYMVITEDEANYGVNSFNFHGDFTEGNHTVYMQWKTFTGSTVRVRERTLCVIALPA